MPVFRCEGPEERIDRIEHTVLSGVLDMLSKS
jgi:hypothetical protein